TGLLSYPLDLPAARAHLAASIYLQMALRPDIIHIVGYTEADHAATAADVIESARMARRVIENALRGAPDLTADPLVQARKAHLIAETRVTLAAIRSLGDPEGADPLTDPAVLAKAVTTGILDAPQLRSNRFGRGTVRTRIIGGACLAVDEAGQPLPEAQRIEQLFSSKEQAA
ncbi:MAG: methionine synthase, partial [Bellilinea sp.]